jgi:hypothetical protein
LRFVLCRLIGHRELIESPQSVIKVGALCELERVYPESVQVVHLVTEEIARGSDLALKA